MLTINSHRLNEEGESNPSTIDEEVRNSYVLSFGELGDFGGFPVIQFIIFALFSFFVPLVLMNMLIAIMSDVYERVQSNAAAADARQLAEMIHEMEELVMFWRQTIRRQEVKDAYSYCFYT